MKPNMFHTKELVKERRKNITWLIGTFVVFLILSCLLIFYISNSFMPKASLPFDLPVSITFTNITNHLICTGGISYPNFIVRGDSLQCYLLTKNKPNDPNYNITFETGFLEAQPFYIPWNHTAYPNIKINETAYQSEYFTIPIPDTQTFMLLITQKGYITPPPILFETLSETDVKQNGINLMLFLIASIIALLGIFPTSKAIRDLLNYQTRRLK